MIIRTALSVAARVIALTIILFICFAVAGRVIEPTGAPTSEDPGAAAGMLLAVCALDASVLAYVIRRSRWTGWRLMVATCVIFYGVMTFMSQIESAVFITRLPPGMLPRLFLAGVLIAAPFSVLAVLVMGKGKPAAEDTEPSSRLIIPPREWSWRLTAIMLVYVVLYFTFGYFIAWRHPEVREYYAGTDEGSFVAQIGSDLAKTPWLFPFQMLRALLWVAIGLPLIRMMKGRWQETALALGLVYAVLMSAHLLLPNPYMPEAVRMAHLVETASSNFLFGCFVGWLLSSDQLSTRFRPASLAR